MSFRADSPPFDPYLAIRVLNHQGVRFLIVGGMAAAMYGSPSVTGDLDVCYARDPGNLVALAAALQELHARLRGAEPGVPFLLDAETLRNGLNFTFVTDAGDLDCLGIPSGTEGYDDLIHDAVAVELEPGTTASFCSLDALRRMKRAAGRPKDRIELEILDRLATDQALGADQEGGDTSV
jgi:hypothetical protein